MELTGGIQGTSMTTLVPGLIEPRAQSEMVAKPWLKELI
jgi:hypothetical protein